MNVVMIIPTGIGCEIGGHAGDATPVARLLASVCDKLVLHPNVVNASDINEMPENSLYVEGSQLDRFLRGEFYLEEVKNNKILVVVNAPAVNETINAVSASRVTLGIDANILELKTPLQMIATMENNIASGDVFGWTELLNQVKDHNFDALAIATKVDVAKEIAVHYFENGGTNPWGGVEAKASKLIANQLNKPVAHAPVDGGEIPLSWMPVVDPRMAPEIVSICFLHCVLKGLHKAPRISDKGLSVSGIDCLVSPDGCWREPHKACAEAGIPIIFVKENKTVCNIYVKGHLHVENYLEAAGVISAMKTGVTLESVTRPLKPTTILTGEKQ